MSINMTQDFQFETDEFKSFEEMMRAAVHTMFGGRNSRYRQLYVSAHIPDYWHDGSEYDWSHRPSIVQIDGKWRKLKAAGCLSGLDHLQLEEGEYEGPDDIGREYESAIKIPPSRLFVCKIGDYIGSIKPGDARHRNTLGAIDDVLKRVQSPTAGKSIIELLEENNIRNPLADLDSSGFDGGYRIHWEPLAGWDELVVSLIWVYYSK